MTFALFPRAAVLAAVAQYHASHGHDPNVLLVNSKDAADWILSSFGGRLPSAILGLELRIDDSVPVGQMDLASTAHEPSGPHGESVT